jgi:hypothetical protein
MNIDEWMAKLSSEKKDFRKEAINRIAFEAYEMGRDMEKATPEEMMKNFDKWNWQVIENKINDLFDNIKVYKAGALDDDADVILVSDLEGKA